MSDRPRSDPPTDSLTTLGEADHRDHPRGAFFTLGAFGQTVYVDPVAELVMAKLSCHPGAGAFDNTLLAFPAIADAFSPL